MPLPNYTLIRKGAKHEFTDLKSALTAMQKGGVCRLVDIAGEILAEKWYITKPAVDAPFIDIAGFMYSVHMWEGPNGEHLMDEEDFEIYINVEALKETF